MFSIVFQVVWILTFLMIAWLATTGPISQVIPSLSIWFVLSGILTVEYILDLVARWKHWRDSKQFPPMFKKGNWKDNSQDLDGKTLSS